MNSNVKQILASLTFIAVGIISFIIFAPLFIFLIILLVIYSFIIRRKIIKENYNFFKSSKAKKGRIIDQESDYCNNSNKKLK
ncbi:MAG: hypothetical protein Kow0076_8680 [Francisella sp.]